ncbi:2-oxoglutarate dehydrogenase complex dihydrolipoyllysine-residue succinyltransferase [Draconibacterium sp. IB214405]|uniref:2-oxoglutarate dehydrogenase complex dihydrolipoyllysine-residue succinyltransferase n=1 Tax=Draconibacterium sp. IB214405 TaxID=3097352 RepID=UPI002A172F62|nr:2-oxoglutarate dehydrogenase complex dihydrolipoyllysine-residue succinyltransferase [Draconibacterium sp. IB214405]MDX8340318.1 2-oxoglutarate dehydrogenase complex dihydrolipoyllysine-residue succinyltransferase [Draconibacterium sp. IB214405]
MIIEIKVPSPGESITEVEIGSWLVEDGAVVAKDQEIAEVESDKATLTIVASEGGKIEIKAEEGEAVEVGAVVCTIDTSVEAPAASEKPKAEEKAPEAEAPKAKAAEEKPAVSDSTEHDKVKVTSVAKEIMKEHGLSVDDVINGLKRLGKKEVEAVVNAPQAAAAAIPQKEATRDEERQRMSSLRRKLSARLVSVKNETAMLTTFNEVDMSYVMDMRKKYQQKFVDTHGFKVGFMSFFTKAVATAMDFHPMVNAQIDGDEIVMPQFVDVGIAVSTPKGLMVPIVRNAESKTIPAIELEIKELAAKARNKKITVEELTGGTFTITNGGVFGSLLSTPIINPPQSGILGMHNIVERPVAVNGQVVIRPMMYVALSYDHRIIDGKDSVGFLVKLKKLLENPELLFTGGKDAGELMLGI